MLGKKQSLDEKMAHSIHYNLSILKHAVKTTPEFDDIFSTTMFLKSNTKAFIYITHFLFNIIDAKDFKAKFYWPISEKKAENAYRSASIEFINHLIDKHKLAQDKIKLVFVVHPCGKKFMSLILDLIMLAQKEIMKRHKIPAGRSIDMDEVLVTCTEMREVETELVDSLKLEAKAIKEKTCAIQELINKRIYPSGEFPLTFTEFIESWHENNKTQLAGINERSEQMKIIYEQTAAVIDRAKKMLATKSFETIAPPADAVKDIAEFYENVGYVDENIPNATVGDKLNFPWLIAQLHLVLPTIVKYTSSYTIDSSDTILDELKVLQRLALETTKIDTKIGEFNAMFKKVIGAMNIRLKKLKEERERDEQENETPEDLAIQAAKDQIDLEQLKLLASPKYYFDASKECLKHVVVKKNRLALMDDDEGKENLANETKFYRPVKSPYVNKHAKLNQSAMMNGMGPPKLHPPQRRRLDSMAMLEKATSGASKSRRDLNSTGKFTGAIPKHPPRMSTPRFSSTMLSPDLHQNLFNCSTVSEISKSSPVLPQTPAMTLEAAFDEVLKIQEPKNFDMDIFKAKPTSVITEELDIPWDNAEFMTNIQKSPKGGLTSLVRAEEIFKATPKLQLNNETIKAADGSSTTLVTSLDSYEAETTIRNKTDINNISYSFASVKLPTDENLFNISDSILRDVDD